MRERNRLCAAVLGTAIMCCFVGVALAGEIRHRFVCVDNGAQKLLCVDQKHPGKSWTVAIPRGSRDLQLVGKDRVLVSHGDGAGEYALKDGKQLWRVSGFKKVQTARRMADGHTLLGTDGGPFVVVDRAGKTLRQITMPKHATSHLRLARILANGHILFVAGRRVIEADQAGKIISTLALAGTGYVAHRCANGHTIATAGGAGTVQEFDAKGQVVRTWGGRDKHAGFDFPWFSGLDVLANGHVVVANWHGHGYKGKDPHVIEFDAANKIVWSWADLAKVKFVTNVLVLE